uniref:Uncharacterized protein n=1 Tax=Nelumbo nucifera TaxID=4432 RepID=A0A822ZAR3_NELNU|nr:TPA_asm: hypothetical protein HUJ06_014858 [Nelumbo nucifera]
MIKKVKNQVGLLFCGTSYVLTFMFHLPTEHPYFRGNGPLLPKLLSTEVGLYVL